ncbi:MAG: T9SS type A sorting domain-containing protein [Calditrichaeota bacterium]|nr:T9SS type A sorting domain-containing protein [Calditrichota bacterium]
MTSIARLTILLLFSRLLFAREPLPLEEVWRVEFDRPANAILSQRVGEDGNKYLVQLDSSAVMVSNGEIILDSDSVRFDSWVGSQSENQGFVIKWQNGAWREGAGYKFIRRYSPENFQYLGRTEILSNRGGGDEWDSWHNYLTSIVPLTRMNLENLATVLVYYHTSRYYTDFRGDANVYQSGGICSIRLDNGAGIDTIILGSTIGGLIWNQLEENRSFLIGQFLIFERHENIRAPQYVRIRLAVIDHNLRLNSHVDLDENAYGWYQDGSLFSLMTTAKDRHDDHWLWILRNYGPRELIRYSLPALGNPHRFELPNGLRNPLMMLPRLYEVGFGYELMYLLIDRDRSITYLFPLTSEFVSSPYQFPVTPLQILEVDDDRDGETEWIVLTQRTLICYRQVDIDLGVTAEPLLTMQFALSPFPNPFNSQVRIGFSLKEESDIRLTIHDLIGREVKVMESGRKMPGYYDAVWNADNHPAGVYFCRLNIKGNEFTQKLVLLK